MLPTRPTTNPIKTARLSVTPHLSIRRGAAAIGICLTSLQRYEAEGFDPAKLREATLSKMEAVYGVTREQLLGRAPIELPAVAG